MYITPIEAYSLNVLNSTKNRSHSEAAVASVYAVVLTYCCHCVSHSTWSGSSTASLHVLKGKRTAQ